MKVVIFLALVGLSSANILMLKPDMEYEGKVTEPITEDAVSRLCKALDEEQVGMKESEHKGDRFFHVPLPQQGRQTIMWWKKGMVKTAMATLSYQTGCYRWEMRPCYGYYPNAFSHPCTFWIPRAYPGGKCVFDIEEVDESLTQKPVTLQGRSASQLCSTAMQAIDKHDFTMIYIPLQMNLASDHRCETWKFTPDDEMGKWEMEVMAKEECDSQRPEFNIEELEDPGKSHVQCVPNLSGEYECFFDDNNMPVEKQIEIQNKP